MGVEIGATLQVQINDLYLVVIWAVLQFL